ncbi:hydrogen peroxide-inducible genes activator [Pseudovibrio flavus]|uniref:hydrogen peroxide-inducible genes activator n=1 Tax=Pseudovibrio flavus TaxID=2529854 RepID=UPI0012BD3B2F|nr:hydrogen peroxide-inducible genes activator [Pseudovibrio flavus]
MLTLRQLQYFKALATHLSFSKAAQACGITQSTLSAAIKQLEDALGAELVDRTGRVLMLTEAGEMVLARGSGLLLEAEDLVQGVQMHTLPMTGRFRFGVIPSIAPYILPGLLPRLREQYPQLKLHLREDLSRNLMNALSEGKLDAVLMALPYNIAGYEYAEVGKDEFLLAVPSSNALSKFKTVSRDKLSGQKLLLLEDGHCLRDHVLSAVGAKMEVHGDEVQATSMTTLVQMVDNGFGLTLIPRLAAAAGVANGTSLCFAAIEGRKAMRDIGVVWRKHASIEGNAMLMASFLKEILGPVLAVK